jgi:probable F420-dependent oxidoreductase
MGHHPFRFGISFGGITGRTELVTAIHRAEAAGFEVACTADHISSRLSVMPLLSLATEASAMRVSPMVIANDYRHPVVVARDGASLDILSEGRFELGIGTGWIKEQYDSVGLAYDPPSVRVARLEEALQVILGCWSGEPFTFTGTHYQVEDVTCPRPVQQPRPPILIAGSGRRMLTLAGRVADMVSISAVGGANTGFADFDRALGGSGSRIEEQLDWVKAGAGQRFDDVVISVYAHHLQLGDDIERAADELAATWGTTPEQILASPHVLLGATGEIIETLQERRERYGISYVVFQGTDLGDAEPVVSALAGT